MYKYILEIYNEHYFLYRGVHILTNASCFYVILYLQPPALLNFHGWWEQVPIRVLLHPSSLRSTITTVDLKANALTTALSGEHSPDSCTSLLLRWKFISCGEISSSHTTSVLMFVNIFSHVVRRKHYPVWQTTSILLTYKLENDFSSEKILSLCVHLMYVKTVACKIWSIDCNLFLFVNRIKVFKTISIYWLVQRKFTRNCTIRR